MGSGLHFGYNRAVEKGLVTHVRNKRFFDVPFASACIGQYPGEVKRRQDQLMLAFPFFNQPGIYTDAVRPSDHDRHVVRPSHLRSVCMGKIPIVLNGSEVVRKSRSLPSCGWETK